VTESPRFGAGVAAGGGELTVKRTPIVAGEPVAPAAVAVIVLVYVPGPRPLGFMVTVIVLAPPVDAPLDGDTVSHVAPVEREYERVPPAVFWITKLAVAVL
jgi:hypothetical protein